MRTDGNAAKKPIYVSCSPRILLIPVPKLVPIGQSRYARAGLLALRRGGSVPSRLQRRLEEEPLVARGRNVRVRPSPRAIFTGVHRCAAGPFAQEHGEVARGELIMC